MANPILDWQVCGVFRAYRNRSADSAYRGLRCWYFNHKERVGVRANAANPILETKLYGVCETTVIDPVVKFSAG